jgi:Ca2+-binding RTX toxin-like protein
MLIGGVGADHLDGGAGSDTASYAASAARVVVNLAIGAASGGDAQGDTLTSIENLTGSAFADVLTGDDNANVLTSGAGGDTLTGGGGADLFVFHAGEATPSPISPARAGKAISSNSTVTGPPPTAPLCQLDASHWQINSADGLIHDVITLSNAADIDPADFIFGG